MQATSRQNHHGCDLTKGFLVHHHLLEVISNQSAAIDCVSEVGGGINYIAATTATYTEAAVPSGAAAVARPVVIYGLTSELEYQAATETILKEFLY